MVEHEIDIHFEAYRESGARLIMGLVWVVDPKTIEVALNDGGAYSFRRRERPQSRLARRHPRHSRSRGGAHRHAYRGARPRRSPLASDRARGRLCRRRMGQAFRRFGSRVAVIEPGGRMAGREDPEHHGIDRGHTPSRRRRSCPERAAGRRPKTCTKRTLHNRASKLSVCDFKRIRVRERRSRRVAPILPGGRPRCRPQSRCAPPAGWPCEF